MRHSSLWGRRRISATSIPPVALLAPRVTVVVVAQGLPEARLVVVEQPEPPDPLGALPEVEVRDEQAGGAAVFRFERGAVVGVGDPGSATRYVLERQIGGVAAVGEGEHVLCTRLDPFEQGIYGHSFPAGAELRPLRDAVDVAGDLLRWERPEPFPRPSLRLIDLTRDREIPPIERRARR